MIAQGLHYLLDSLVLDPPTLATILVGTILAGARGDLRARLLAAGVVLHLAAVVRVGGDFMSGRFLAADFVVAAICCVRAAADLPRLRVALAGGLTLAASFALPESPVRRVANPEARVFRAAFDAFGVADERAIYFADTSPRRIALHQRVAGTKWAEMGREVAAEGRPAVISKIEMAGFFGGPDLLIVDPLALSDPLLARLPIPDVRPYWDPSIRPPQAPYGRIDRGWRIGHYRRELPEGYLESLTEGRNRIRDPKIARLHDDLQLVVRGPIWRRERFAAMLRLNLGFR